MPRSIPFYYIFYGLHVGDISSISPSSLYLFQRLQGDICLGTMKKPSYLSRASMDREDQPILISCSFEKYKEMR